MADHRRRARVLLRGRNHTILDALRDARAAAIKEGIVPSIYCHPIGYHGHAAGTPIGMTDYQQGVPIRGDYMFYPYTWHSIELNATFKVPEWGGQAVRFPLEEDAVNAPLAIDVLARVAAQLGEPDRAIAALQTLLSIPAEAALAPRVPLTPALLRLDPMFDPLRNDPRFQKLCEDKAK